MSENNLLNALTQEGVLINVSVKFWRAARKLKPEDLGLAASEVNTRLISLGHKKLLPADALQAFALIESRAHSLIEENTFPFLNGLGHFLPNRKLADVTAKLTALECRFRAETELFLEKYAGLRVAALKEWRTTAGRLGVDDPAKLLSAIEAGFPVETAVGRYFGFDTQVFQIALPEGVSTEATTLAGYRQVVESREAAARSARERISAGVETFVSDCVTTMRQETAKLCGEMVQSMQESETGVHQKTLNRLVKFIDRFKALNFAGDRDLEAQLDDARRRLLGRSAEHYRDSTGSQAALREGLQKLGNEARRLAGEDARELVERFGEQGKRRFHLAA